MSELESVPDEDISTRYVSLLNVLDILLTEIEKPLLEIAQKRKEIQVLEEELKSRGFTIKELEESDGEESNKPGIQSGEPSS